MEQGLLQVQDVSYRYNNKYIIQNLDFELKLGQSLILAGPNGAGKSTTLKILAGYLKAYTGTISKPKISVIGFLPETPPLYDELTIREYLSFCAALHNIPLPLQDAAIVNVINQLELIDFSKQLIGNLSKGIRQRVGLAQAIIHKPTILLLDEPSSNLDIWQQAKLLNFLQKIKQNTIMIISTHNQEEIIQLGDACLLFNQVTPVVQGPISITEALSHSFSRFETPLFSKPILEPPNEVLHDKITL